MIPNFEYEEKYWKKGYSVIGIDEVGRGACAGPVYVSAVYFSPKLSTTEKKHILQLGIKDSKKLTALKREILSQQLKDIPIQFSVESSPIECINTEGIVEGLQKAMKKSIEKLRVKSEQDRTIILIDGNKSQCIKDVSYTQIPIIKGDSKSISIASASILAKVARDTYMKELSVITPQYAWHRNMGYGTKDHFEAIKIHGLTDHHRLLYLRKFLTKLDTDHGTGFTNPARSRSNRK